MQAPCPVPENARDARRKAALARVARAGAGLHPALAGQAQASLQSAFALSDLMRRVTEGVDA